MNKLYLFFAVVLASLSALADEGGQTTWIELQKNAGREASVLAYFEESIVGDVSLYAVGFKDSMKYQEFYVGPKVKFSEWLEAGIGIGHENQPSGTRRNVYVSSETDAWSLYASWEFGPSGPYHKVIALGKVSEHFNVGVHDETYLGFGPRIDYAITKKWNVWAALLYDRHPTSEHKRQNFVLATNYTF